MWTLEIIWTLVESYWSKSFNNNVNLLIHRVYHIVITLKISINNNLEMRGWAVSRKKKKTLKFFRKKLTSFLSASFDFICSLSYCFICFFNWLLAASSHFCNEKIWRTFRFSRILASLISFLCWQEKYKHSHTIGTFNMDWTHSKT